MKNKSYTIIPSLMLQVIDDEAILMDTESREFYELNESALVLWNIMTENNNLDDVLNQMLETFEVSKEQVENDLNNFIEYLQSKNLLKIN